MDIIETQQGIRKKRVSRIASALYEVLQYDLDVDVEKLIAETCVELGVSRRTSMEYIRIAVVSGGYVWKDGKISNSSPSKQKELAPKW